MAPSRAALASGKAALSDWARRYSRRPRFAAISALWGASSQAFFALWMAPGRSPASARASLSRRWASPLVGTSWMTRR